MHTFRVPYEIPVFKRVELRGPRLILTDQVLVEGECVELLRSEHMILNEEKVLAMSFVAPDGRTYYILAEGSGIDGDDIPNIEDLWLQALEEQNEEFNKGQDRFFTYLREHGFT